MIIPQPTSFFPKCLDRKTLRCLASCVRKRCEREREIRKVQLDLALFLSPKIPLKIPGTLWGPFFSLSLSNLSQSPTPSAPGVKFPPGGRPNQENTFFPPESVRPSPFRQISPVSSKETLSHGPAADLWLCWQGKKSRKSPVRVTGYFFRT